MDNKSVTDLPQLTVSIDNVDDAVVGSAKADAYYPEFKYSVDADRSSNLARLAWT